jgi:hypothetical protein
VADFPKASKELFGDSLEGYHQFMSDNLSAALYEKELFDKLGPVIREYQYLTIDQIIDIIKWRTPAEPGHVKRNDPERVKVISRQALTQPDEEIKTHVLTLIKGIAIPTASKILAVAYPEEYPTLNRMGWLVLSRWRYLDGKYSVTNQSWMNYLQSCRMLMQRYDLTGQMLDQALIAIYLRHEEKLNLQKFIPLDQFF